jgi:hypothetical protein
MPRIKVEECLGFDQEGPMIANVVNDVEVGFSLSHSQAPSKLLKPNDSRLSGTKHHDGINLGEVNPFVEKVHRKDDI